MVFKDFFILETGSAYQRFYNAIQNSTSSKDCFLKIADVIYNDVCIFFNGRTPSIPDEYSAFFKDIISKYKQYLNQDKSFFSIPGQDASPGINPWYMVDTGALKDNLPTGKQFGLSRTNETKLVINVFLDLFGEVQYIMRSMELTLCLSSTQTNNHEIRLFDFTDVSDLNLTGVGGWSGLINIPTDILVGNDMASYISTLTPPTLDRGVVTGRPAYSYTSAQLKAIKCSMGTALARGEANPNYFYLFFNNAIDNAFYYRYNDFPQMAWYDNGTQQVVLDLDNLTSYLYSSNTWVKTYYTMDNWKGFGEQLFNTRRVPTSDHNVIYRLFSNTSSIPSTLPFNSSFNPDTIDVSSSDAASSINYPNNLNNFYSNPQPIIFSPVQDKNLGTDMGRSDRLILSDDYLWQFEGDIPEGYSDSMYIKWIANLFELDIRKLHDVWPGMHDQPNIVNSVFIITPEINGDYYVRTNTPSSLSYEIRSKKKKTPDIEDNSNSVLSYLQIGYYRKVIKYQTGNNSYLYLVPKNLKGVRYKQYKPVGIQGTGSDANKVLCHLPLCMSHPSNARIFMEKKSTMPALKVKRNELGHGSRDTRKDAGTVMNDLKGYINTPSSINTFLNRKSISKLSATVMAEATIRFGNIQGEWTWWKGPALDGVSTASAASSLPKFPTVGQEWCHLMGHGDGGVEELYNFAAASNYCNTEQLAIEIGEREARKESGQKFIQNVTAYLLENKLSEGESPIFTKSYIDTKTPDDGEDAAATSGLNRGNQGKGTTQNPTGTTLPVALFFRYKISKNSVKVFDHTFEGQSEFFDLNQFNILCQTTKYMLLGKDALLAKIRTDLNLQA